MHYQKKSDISIGIKIRRKIVETDTNEYMTLVLSSTNVKTTIQCILGVKTQY